MITWLLATSLYVGRKTLIATFGFSPLVCTSLNPQRSLFALAILVLGIALPLASAGTSPNQTMTVTNTASGQACSPIETQTAGITVTYYACPATIQVSVRPILPDLGWTGLILLMLLGAAAIIVVTLLAVIVYGLRR